MKLLPRLASIRRASAFAVMTVLLSAGLGTSVGQDQAASAVPGALDGKAVQIAVADGPTAIDPATVMNPRLAEKVTVEFEAASLADVYRWLQSERRFRVAVDAAALKTAGVLSSELVTEKLADEPLYLLLDRLQSLGVGWYEHDGELRITTTNAAAEFMSTESFNIGEYVDSGIEAEAVTAAIMECTGGDWKDAGDEDGGLMLLGDVVFVRQNERTKREVRGLLAALKTPARRVITLDAPQNAVQLEKLEQSVTVRFSDTPLSEVVAELIRQTGVDLRLHQQELKLKRVRDLTPVTFEVAEMPLGTTLNSLLSELELEYRVDDGVIWIGIEQSANLLESTAVFDVRDLCGNSNDTHALRDALLDQAGGLWAMEDGEGGEISVVKGGLIAVRNTPATLDEVSRLLENYRIAVKGSKRRETKAPDEKAVSTHYYRMPSAMAKELLVRLPQLVQPATWKSEAQPNAIGTIELFASTSEVLAATVAHDRSQPAPPSPTAVVEHCVLRITQHRDVHREIHRLIEVLSDGDKGQRLSELGLGGFSGGGSGGGMGGGGLGGGGFGGGGGGFFSRGE